MKIRYTALLFLILAVGLLQACFRPPELPLEPEISFNKLEFSADEDGIETLLLFLDFQDGDGDLGLDGSDNRFPYQPFDVVIDSKLDTVFFSDDPDNPALPPFSQLSPTGEIIPLSATGVRPEFTCEDYEIFIDPDTGVRTDTVYIVKNPSHENMKVRFFRKFRGEYTEFDWNFITSTVGCGEDFDGRFPVFDARNLEEDKPLAGTIEYSMQSVILSTVMRRDTFRLEVSILDRALNESNTVITPDFTIPGLQGE